MSDDHGTPQRARRCRKHPAGPCEHCRWALALYQELYRWTRDPALTAREAATNARRAHAYAILAGRHPVEFAQIMRDLTAQDAPHTLPHRPPRAPNGTILGSPPTPMGS